MTEPEAHGQTLDLTPDRTAGPSVGMTLAACLDQWTGDDAARIDVATTIAAVAAGATELAHMIGRGPLAGDQAAVVFSGEAGEGQKALDVVADRTMIEAMRAAPVAAVASEEDEAPVLLDPNAPLLVALDPLDGSSNIDTDLSIGTIFSVLPRRPGVAADAPACFFQSGRAQLAAGYVLYGPHTAMMLTLGAGTWHFVLDEGDSFRLVDPAVAVPTDADEFAINMSNYRHWDDPVRLYVDDCVAGLDGPRGRDFNMRWLGSMVAEAHRLFSRGGVYLYPGDGRKGYGEGRLRLLYEAFPIAFLMEQAGGAASDCIRPVLDLVPDRLHQRIPLVFGSRQKVASVARYHLEPNGLGERSPLFGRRGLFR